MGCDGVKKWGDGPSFAHGGSGIIISRGAMEKVMPNLDKCIKRYKPCWAGDVRMALCLRDQGILLENAPAYLFNRDPPHSKFDYPSNACHNPITFHHLLVDQIQKLYDHEMAMHEAGKYVSYADLFQDWVGSTEGTLEKGNRGGRDYANEPAQSAELCLERCKQDAKCLSFAYTEEGICWLKEGIPAMVSEKNTFTGHFGSKYKCKSSSFL
jgi:Protein of unknown function, DUF604/PAN domain